MSDIITHEGFISDTSIENAIRQVLVALGLDPNDENFRETPKRVRKMYREVFDGVKKEAGVEKILSVTFPSEYDGIIIHSDMLVFSFCPHHLLPVELGISIAYMAPKTV